MSESVAKQRPSIDLDEFERRLRGPSPAARSQEDPLAELARLVGGGAPLMAPSEDLPKATDQPGVVSPPDWQSHEEAAALPPAVVFDPGSLRGALPEEPVEFAADPASSYEDEQFSPGGPIESGEDRPPRSRRALYLMSGALALVLAGIAVTFAMRGHAHDGGEAPTIEAAAGPTKVQPATPDGVDVADRDASLLDRSGADDVSSSRVVDHQEQPVDLQTIRSQRPAAGNAANAAQAQGAATGAAPPAAASAGYFPEPKRVRTVSVRPDGTLIADDPPSARSFVASNDPSAVTRAAAGAGSAANPNVATDVPLPVARPTTPKTTARIVTTPKATPAVAGAADPGTGIPPAVIPLKSRPAPAAPAAPTKPTRVADATGSGDAGKVLPASAAAGGGYAVQLAAPASEQEANDTMARLEKKFAAELDGRHTAVEKADSNGRTVYRVRIVGLASDDANVLCSRLKAGGGACFVARD
jgi:hypothetical protein